MAEKIPPTATFILEIFNDVSRVTERMPFLRRSPAERKAVGHLLFARAPELTSQVAFALSQRPAVYPDLAGEAQAIQQGQDTALAYYQLHSFFATLAARCLDSYTVHQAEAVQRSKRVLDRVSRLAEDPTLRPDLQHQRRLDLLWPAYHILREVRGHLQRKPAQAKKPKKDAGPAPDRQAAAEQRTQRRSRLFETMLRGLRR